MFCDSICVLVSAPTAAGLKPDARLTFARTHLRSQGHAVCECDGASLEIFSRSPPDGQKKNQKNKHMLPPRLCVHLLLSQPQPVGLVSCIVRLGIVCGVPVAAVATIELALGLVFLCITAAAIPGFLLHLVIIYFSGRKVMSCGAVQ